MSAEGKLPAAPGRRRGGGGAAIAALFVAFIVATAAFAAGWFLGGRRTTLVTESPARDGVAFVLEGRCAAGLCESLRVGPDMKRAKIVETLNGSAEHADEIAWTPDGGRVAFIVNGYQLRLFDARTGQSLGAMALIDPHGIPTSRGARGGTF